MMSKYLHYIVAVLFVFVVVIVGDVVEIKK